MASDKIDLQEIQQLIALVEKYGLAELSVSEKSLTVTVRNAQETVEIEELEAAPVTRPRAALARRTAASAPPSAAVQQPERPTVPLVSPMTGVFYTSPSPDAPVFVEPGEVIRVGQTVGLIEAMKVFSEVPSEISGRLVEIRAQNGALVQAGETLMLVEPMEGTEE
ncbi:MAG: acetyl-CoA carboxylase, biotin carboxyl carrier protein [Armatimonadetes bacterium]|nr:acetyl-CoA carboxylase, biotin carboxyl carrier protein [Armatimonadota bacterium]